MRRRWLVFAIWLLAGLVGCQSPPPSSPDTQPTGGAPSGRIRIAMMPKKIGIEYFTVCRRGAEEAARELGDVDLLYDGPLKDSSEEQSRKLDNWRLQRFNAILIACNDPDQIAPAIRRCRDAGIHVLTYDADANPDTSGREFFINQATVDGIAQALLDEMVKQVGESATVGVVTSSLTAPNQNAWLAAMERYRRQRYPRLRMLEPRPSEEDQTKAIVEAQNIIKTHPDVRGIFGLSSVAFPGVAEAVKQQGKAGQIAVVGLSNPKTMRPYIEEGVVRSGILWNVPDLGYLAVYAARAVARGELKPGDRTFSAGRLGRLSIGPKGEIVLGRPLIYDASNVAKYDF